MENTGGSRTFQSRVIETARQPRVTLLILAVWSLLAALTQVFVNSPLFLDLHERELDGAIGGFAFSFNAVPLIALYVYCARDPGRYYHVFWLALVHQGAMVFGNLYHLVIGTFTAESIVVPLAGSIALGLLAFAQVFTPSQGSRQGEAGA